MWHVHIAIGMRSCEPLERETGLTDGEDEHIAAAYLGWATTISIGEPVHMSYTHTYTWEGEPRICCDANAAMHRVSGMHAKVRVPLGG